MAEATPEEKAKKAIGNVRGVLDQREAKIRDLEAKMACARRAGYELAKGAQLSEPSSAIVLPVVLDDGTASYLSPAFLVAFLTKFLS